MTNQFEDVPEDSSEDEEWVSTMVSTAMQCKLTAKGENDPILRRRKAQDPPASRFQAMTHNLWEKAKPTLQAINQFMTVPMWAALISIFIAMIPPLQAFLNRMEPVKKAIKGAGQCSSQ
jgi:hypothetical protein